MSNLNWCHTEMIFDVLTEERRIGETEQVTDLLNTIVGLLQIVTDILNYNNLPTSPKWGMRYVIAFSF